MNCNRFGPNVFLKHHLDTAPSNRLSNSSFSPHALHTCVFPSCLFWKINGARYSTRNENIIDLYPRTRFHVFLSVSGEWAFFLQPHSTARTAASFSVLFLFSLKITRLQELKRVISKVLIQGTTKKERRKNKKERNLEFFFFFFLVCIHSQPAFFFFSFCTLRGRLNDDVIFEEFRTLSSERCATFWKLFFKCLRLSTLTTFSRLSHKHHR